MVGLERTYYSVSEGDGLIEVCAVVSNPTGTCPIDFTFTVDIDVRGDNAGKYLKLVVMYIPLILINHSFAQYQSQITAP